MASDIFPRDKSGRARNKVALKPGFSLMDWMRLCNSSTDLAGRQGAPLRAITMEEVQQHRTEHDAWSVFFGKVYNITPYLHYHPGGVSILMKVAGKDGTALFNKYHAWVNLDGMLSKCLIGHLAATVDTIAEGDEKEDESDDDEAKPTTRQDVVRSLEESSDV